jgi:streptomycin 6-kinase
MVRGACAGGCKPRRNSGARLEGRTGAAKRAAGCRRAAWRYPSRHVLDFAARGWLAIDPKGLSGERGFDFANIFCNPDFALATATGRLARQASIVAKAAGMDRKRLLQWVLAYAGLSAAWFIDDGGDPGLPLAVAEAAAAELSN